MEPWIEFKQKYPTGEHAFKTKMGYGGLIRQVPETLHLCGYVLLPEGHPLYGADYDDVDFEVHGGLTFAGDLYGVWALGFDCAHYMDLVPGFHVKGISEMEVYRDEVYVKQEIERLAEQVEDMRLDEIKEWV